jgi:hypothetical protein
LSGGQYWVLAVGGGNGGFQAGQWIDRGQPGNVNEGYWEFPANEKTFIQVGERNATNVPANDDLSLSFISERLAGYGVQGVTDWGSTATGRGGDGHGNQDGYKSFITGEERQFASASAGDEVPGRGGINGGEQRDGCIIIATVTNDETDWNPPGSLPGLGGWATITGVTGTYTKHTYGDWIAYEWTEDGEVTTVNGLAEVLVVGAGGTSNNSTPVAGGGVSSGLLELDGTCVAKVGQNSGPNGYGGNSVFYDKKSDQVLSSSQGGPYSGAGAGGHPTQWSGVYSSVKNGSPTEYGVGWTSGQPTPPLEFGNANNTGNAGRPAGCVIIRVPKEYAPSVQENRHGWLNFATVENGVVTSVNKTPDNLPYTAATDEVPCGPEVSEGWNYDGSEFVAPDPDYSDQIKQLEETLQTLRGAK